MANQEQLAILKQGVEVWNKWRQESDSIIDLTDADLRPYPLQGIDFSDAYLIRTNLSQVDMSAAYLDGARLRGANCSKSNFSDVNFSEVAFDNANLTEANLTNGSYYGARFKSTVLEGANLSGSLLGETIFFDVNLSQVSGLENINHHAPSILSIGTIHASLGRLPVSFLRGCGLNDWEIEYAKLYDPNLDNHAIDDILYEVHNMRASQSLQISPLFISYSHADSVFVDKVEAQLNRKGIRFWRDIHNMRAGRMEKQVDRAMRLNPTVLLVLSKHSLASDWVEHEVRTARSLEKEMEKDVLCPVALDDSWKNSPWSKRIMEQIMEYNILDFSDWKDDTRFEGAFNKLLDSLELFYK